MLDWVSTPKPEISGWHRKFEGCEWRYDMQGVYTDRNATEPLRTPGSPITCQAILDIYGSDIFEASVAHKVPPEVILMTVATEVGTYRTSNFTGPPTFRWEANITDYSAGPMQLLGSTARALLRRLRLPKDWKDLDIPRYELRPLAPPSIHPLYEGRLSIWLGTAYIAANADSFGTNFDPILVAACYNRGRLAQSGSNVWHLAVTGDHLDRAAARYGDACAVLSSLRTQPSSNATKLATQGVPVSDDIELELYSLTPEQADEEEKFYLDSGADVERFPQSDNLVTLIIHYPDAPQLPSVPDSTSVKPPKQKGFVLCIDRTKVEIRKGKSFARTVGSYQAFYDQQPIPDLAGIAIERQGPGDNSKQGDVDDRRIAAGEYPLSTHAGFSNKYKTYDYDGISGLKRRPWPAIRIDGTEKRAGILIHCAAGYLMSVGCVNLSGTLSGADGDINFSDSRSRVIALIEGMKTALGKNFPARNNERIPGALLIIRGEP